MPSGNKGGNKVGPEGVEGSNDQPKPRLGGLFRRLTGGRRSKVSPASKGGPGGAGAALPVVVDSDSPAAGSDGTDSPSSGGDSPPIHLAVSASVNDGQNRGSDSPPNMDSRPVVPGRRGSPIRPIVPTLDGIIGTLGRGYEGGGVDPVELAMASSIITTYQAQGDVSFKRALAQYLQPSSLDIEDEAVPEIITKFNVISPCINEFNKYFRQCAALCNVVSDELARDQGPGTEFHAASHEIEGGIDDLRAYLLEDGRSVSDSKLVFNTQCDLLIPNSLSGNPVVDDSLEQLKIIKNALDASIESVKGHLRDDSRAIPGVILSGIENCARDLALSSLHRPRVTVEQPGAVGVAGGLGNFAER